MLSRLFWFSGLIVASSALAERTHDITIDDYFTQGYIEDCAVSPDGKHVAYVEARWPDDKESARNRDLWIVAVASGEVTRLTFDPGNETDPQWSPDNRTIYFTGHFETNGGGENAKPPEDGSAQVWRIGIDGDQLLPVTRVKDGISAFALSDDGKRLFYTIDEDEEGDEWKELREEFKDDVEFGHGTNKQSELWALDLSNWRAEKVHDPKRYIRSFDLAPDGTKVAMITDPNDLLINHEGKSEVDVLDLASGEVEQLPDQLWRDEAPSPFGWLGAPSWSPDGAMVAFTVAFDGYPAELLVADWPGGGEARVRRLPRPQEAYVEGGLGWHPGQEDGLCFLGDLRATTPLISMSVNEPAKFSMLTPGVVSVSAFDFSGDGGTLALVQSGIDHPGDLFVSQAGGAPRRLTRINPQVDEWKLPQTLRVAWEAPDGKGVEGILELPPGHDPETDGPLPLIVAIHGGPTGSDQVTFRYWIYGRAAFAAKGYAVLSPNYRGSTGYGDEFLIDLIGRENDIEVADILAGVDAMIERGIADPERLGVMGWSNGGYLTNCLVATNRFKAASSGAGVVDMTIQWGEEDTPGHVINYLEGLPWEAPAEYQEASPLYALKPGIETATLIHVGENDPRVPASHSRALHRALRHYIKAPSELIIYPGAGHGLTTYRHRLAKMKWDHEWFDRYLLGKTGEKKEEKE